MARTIDKPTGRSGRAAVRTAGFTLVEILIVVTIIGILATIVVPQFSNASTQAKENALKDELRYFRTQIIVYKAQHKDVPPGAAGGNFVNQMTLYTNDTGATSQTDRVAYKFGPYLPQIPQNPINQLDTIEIANQDPLVADGGHGWKYNPATQEFIADVVGNDTVGTPYAKY